MLPNGNKQPGGLGQALALFGLLIAISVGVLLFSPSNNPAVSPSTPADQATSVPAPSLPTFSNMKASATLISSPWCVLSMTLLSNIPTIP